MLGIDGLPVAQEFLAGFVGVARRHDVQLQGPFGLRVQLLDAHLLDLLLYFGLVELYSFVLLSLVLAEGSAPLE